MDENYPPINFESTYKLAWVDYLVIAICLAISLSIGIFFAWKDRRKKEDLENYLMAGRSLPAFPVALSLTSSFISAVTILGTPGEFYAYGTMFTYMMLAYLSTAAITAIIIVPAFYNLDIRSTYEYLEMRYENKFIRYLSTIIYIMVTILYNGIVVYSPALALQQVVGIPIWTGTVITMIVCVCYTFLGGLKAVVWTDTFQVCIMMSGFIAVIVMATTQDFNGLGEIFDIAYEGGRIVNDFSFDPTVRHSFLSILIGGTIGVWGAMYGTNQAQIQRYISCKSMKTAQMALLYNGIAICICGVILPGIAGLCMYAYFAECDPVSAGWVGANDQLLAYLNMFVLRDLPGLSGLYLAGVFSGTLSSTSSALNSLTTVVVDDFLDPLVKKHQKLQDSFVSNYTLMSKCLIIFFGLVIYATSVIAPLISGNLIQAALSINSTWGSPLLGLFAMAILVPFSEKWGANIGTICGLLMTNWLWLGVQFYPPSPEKTKILPVRTDGCIDPDLIDKTPWEPKDIPDGLYN